LSSKTILLLIGAAIIALIIAAFQYFFKTKRAGKENVLFAFLRFLSVFLLLVLLINPTINVVSTSTEKPELIVLADQSFSIKHLKQENKLASVLNQIQQNKELSEKFDVFVYGFGNQLYDTLSKTLIDGQTKISYALKNIQKVHRKPNSATVLLTDGNQTYGADYGYYKSAKNQPVYAMAFGDTLQVEDLKVTRVNVNKYAYLNNTFPIEIQVNYSGNNSRNAQLQVYKEKQLVHKEVVNFSESKKSHFTNIKIKASSPGVHRYSAVIVPFEGEKNENNNRKSFVVETIDQKTSVLLVSEIKHPDVAALKRSIESNERRELTVRKPNEVKDLEKYQLVILYQPKSSFKKVYELIENTKIPTFTITGTQTDWNVINRLNRGYKKSAFRQTEEILPILNEQFEIFITDEFSFTKFPPLENSLGSENVSGNFETLLSKKIQGVETNQPLLAFWTENSVPDVVLFGEGIWKWRIHDFKNNEDFKNFDTFLGKIIQFLSNKEKRKRLTVNYESVYYSNNLIKITSNFFNKNYEFDATAKLSISLRSEDKTVNKKVPMVLKGQFFEADLSDLEPNTYNFTVSVSKHNAKVSGTFTVLDFDIEKQFYNANIENLERLVTGNSGKLFYSDQTNTLVQDLLNSEQLKAIQKSKSDQKSLISWKYLLAILLLLLAIEWFLRKYKGLI